MAIEITPLDFQLPDGDEPVRGGDNVIAHNGRRSQELLTEARARLANMEAGKFSRSLDGGTPFSEYPPIGDPVAADPLGLNDSAVVQAVTAGPETKAALDSAYAPVAGSGAYASPASVTASAAAIRAEIERRPARGYGEDRITVGGHRIRPGVDTRYSAFPVQTKLNDDRLLMVWYEATDHITTRDGIVVGSYSSDNGLTWGTKQTFLTIPGIDLRDPTVSTSADGTILYLTYIKCTFANPRDGFFLRRSFDNGATWGPEIRIDPAGSNGAGTAPVVELADGRLMAVWFGMLTGEAWDSCWRAYSTDDGLTWGAPARFLNGVTDSRHYNEPYAAVHGASVAVMYRHGEADQIGVTRSVSSGGSWSTPAPAFVGTGRPSCTITSAGTLIVVFRDLGGSGSTQHAVMKTSPDLGLTWTRYRIVERSETRWMVYSCPTEVAPGVIFCSTAMEISNTSATLSARYLLEGGAISPSGDVAPPVADRAIKRLDQIAIADSFDRPDSTTIGWSENGQVWSAPAGPTVTGGQLDHTASDGPHLVVGRVVAPNMEVEADLQWLTSSGVALVLRYQDQNNYLNVAIESAGTFLRLYKVVAGVSTVLGTPAAILAPAGLFHRVRVIANGDNIRAYFEDELVLTVTDSTFNTAEWAGVRLGVAATTCTHRVRNFVARRRSGRAA